MSRTLLVAFLVSTSLIAACGGSAPPAEQAAPGASASAPSATADKPSAPDASASAPGATADKPKAPPARPAFTRTDLKIGTGAQAMKGKRLVLQYAGWIYDPSQRDLKGRMFDSSLDRGPFDFVLGAGEVIPGWDQGFDGMKIGGRRRLIIPPDLAYGVDGAGGGIIPPNASLLFEMELIDVQ